MCHDNEEWCTTWRGIDLSFQNWHKNFKLILIRTLESLKKNSFQCAPFEQSTCSWNWRRMQNLERNRLVSSKLTKGIWQILASTLKSLKILHFNGLLLRKVYIVWTKKEQRSYISWKWRGLQNLERNRLVASKFTLGIWQILTWPLESLKYFHFIAFLLSKVYMFELKRCREVIFHEIGEWYKIWRKTELPFGKWHKELDKFSPKHLKVSKPEL